MRELAQPIVDFLRHAPWYAAIAGAAGLIVMLWRSVWRRRRAAEARILAALAATVPDALRDGELVAIRGVLEVERAITSVAALGFGGGRELCELGHAAADDAVIVAGERRIRLEGPLAVSVGSHVIRHHTLPTSHFEQAAVLRDRARRAMQLDLWPSGIDAYHLRRVKPGDEVIARGRLRAVDGGFALTPGEGAPGTQAIELSAVAAVVDPVPTPPLGTLARAVLVAVAAWVLVALIAR